MANSVRVVLNRRGVRELLQSYPVHADLMARAHAIAEAAGPGMEVDSEVTPTRARASVRTATVEAAEAEATDRALTRAIGAGGF